MAVSNPVLIGCNFEWNCTEIDHLNYVYTFLYRWVTERMWTCLSFCMQSTEFLVAYLVHFRNFRLYLAKVSKVSNFPWSKASFYKNKYLFLVNSVDMRKPSLTGIWFIIRQGAGLTGKRYAKKRYAVWVSSTASTFWPTLIVFSLWQFWLDKVGKVRKCRQTVRLEFSELKIHAVFTRKNKQFTRQYNRKFTPS